MRFDFRIPPAVALVIWIALAVVIVFVLVESEWQVSQTWESLLRIGLTVFFVFFFYWTLLGPTAFSKHGKSALREYESAWWNQKAVLWICTISCVSLFSNTIGALFLKRADTNLWFNLGLSHPYLLFLWVAVTAPLSSIVMLLLLLVTMSPSKKADWLAKHFNVVFIITALFLFTLQSIMISFGLSGIKRGLN